MIGSKLMEIVYAVASGIFLALTVIAIVMRIQGRI